MMFALGFLCALLFAILILPPIIRNSTRKSLQPVNKKQLASLKESRAEKDQMRAEFAISLRKQEQAVETLKARAQKQLIEIAEGNARIRDMKREMSEVTDLADRRYKEQKNLRRQLDGVKRPKKTVVQPDTGCIPLSDQETEPSKGLDLKGKTDIPDQDIPAKEPRLPGTTTVTAKNTDISDAGKSKGLAGRIYRLKTSS